MIAYTYKSLFDDDSVHKSLIITFNDDDETTFTNDDIYEEDFTLKESILSGEQIQYGEINSNEVAFTVANKTASLKGLTFTVQIVLGNHTESPFTIGTYKVIEDELSADRSQRQIVGCDVLYDVINANVISWYNALFPTPESTITLAQMRHSLASEFSITEETQTLVNDSMVIEKTILATDLSGRDVLFWICELNGVFPHITRGNTLKYLSLGVVNTSPYAITTYKDATYKDYVSNAVTKLQIRQSENDIGVVVGEADTNTYIVENNILVYGKSTADLTTIANNLYSVISVPWYKPCNVSVRANLCVEVGDNFQLTAKDGTVINAYVLDREASGIQAIFDTFRNDGTEYRDTKLNGYTSQITALKGKSNELSRSIEETKSTITDVEQGLQSQITQTANNLTSEITARENGDTDVRSYIDQTAGTINASIEFLQKEIDGDTTMYYVEETPTLLNYPAWDFTYNIPVNNTVQLRDDLRFEYTEEYYQRNVRSLSYNNATGISWRFRKENGTWGWVTVADTDYGFVLQKISELEMTDESITTSVTQIQQNYSTKTETSTQISQSASSIQLSVSQTYETKTNAQTTRQTLESEIQQNATDITAKVSKTGGSQSSFGWSLTDSAFKLFSGNRTVFEANSSGITVYGYTTTQELNAKVAEINDLTTQKLSLKANSGDIIGTINASTEGISIHANKLDLSGLVTVSGLSGGTTTIDGNCIKTGTISATHLDLSGVATYSGLSGGTTTINGGCIKTGTISANRLESSVLTTSNISSRVIACSGISVNTTQGITSAGSVTCPSITINGVLYTPHVVSISGHTYAILANG